jgi:hypothetical protein
VSESPEAVLEVYDHDLWGPVYIGQCELDLSHLIYTAHPSPISQALPL